jgi:hypothetical protein
MSEVGAVFNCAEFGSHFFSVWNMWSCCLFVMGCKHLSRARAVQHSISMSFYSFSRNPRKAAAKGDSSTVRSNHVNSARHQIQYVIISIERVIVEQKLMLWALGETNGGVGRPARRSLRLWRRHVNRLANNGPLKPIYVQVRMP